MAKRFKQIILRCNEYLSAQNAGIKWNPIRRGVLETLSFRDVVITN
jgi:hypothetical protein